MSTAEQRLAQAFPPLGVRVTAGPLELRSISAEDVLALIDVVRDGVHADEVMPFSFPWTDVTDEDLPSHYLQWWWRTLATFSTDAWELNLSAVWEGEVVGVQLGVELGHVGPLADAERLHRARLARGQQRRSGRQLPAGLLVPDERAHDGGDAVEERILAGLKYDELDAHTRLHQELVHRAQVLHLAAIHRQMSMGELIDFIIDDLVKGHMFKQDRKFYCLFKK